MKTCKNCGQEKPYSEFYKQNATDGYAPRCKECVKARVRENYRENIDHYKEYDRKRAMLPHRVEARNEYLSSDRGKEVSTRLKKQWNLDHPIQRAANVMVGNALRDRRMFKPKKCSECGKETSRLEGHHDDYAYPLSVRWLCSTCHHDWHKNNEPLNGD